MKEFQVGDVVLVTDWWNDVTSMNEEWLGYCVGHEHDKGRILVQRRYGMGAWTFAVPVDKCS